MVLSDSGIGSSLYLFTDRHAEYVHGIYVCIAVIALGLFLSLSQYRVHPMWSSLQKWLPFMVCGLISGGIIVHLWLDMKENDRIFKYHAETTGITVKKEFHRTVYTIYYQFEVNGKTYKGDGICRMDPNTTYFPERQHHFKVIYNRNDPAESMMDFMQ